MVDMFRIEQVDWSDYALRVGKMLESFAETQMRTSEVPWLLIKGKNVLANCLLCLPLYRVVVKIPQFAIRAQFAVEMRGSLVASLDQRTRLQQRQGLVILLAILDQNVVHRVWHFWLGERDRSAM